MKLCVVMIMCFVLGASANSFSQHQKVSLELQNADVQDLFSTIKQQTGLRFIYDVNKLASLSNLNIKAEKKQVAKVLDEVFKDTQFKYEIIDDVILVLEKPMVKKVEQETIVKGQVTDKAGNPLPGVSVVVKGTSTGVATDIDGRFELKLIEGKGITLVFSFIGMKTQEIAYKGQSNLKVVLADDSEQLEEVVITGFQRISKERASGSFNKVDSRQLEKPMSDAAESLIGTVTGLQQVVDSRGSTRIEIRGQSNVKTQFGTISGPLVVVDGFPIDGDLNSVNPNDIESITVLKDAAAASIWGARSGNGVVVVTTKKGKKKSATKVEFSSFWKFKAKPNLEKELNRLSSSEQVDLEKYVNETSVPGTNRYAYSPWGRVQDTYKNIQGGYEGGLSLAQTIINEWRLDNLTESKRNAQLDALRKLDNTEQIKKYLLQQNITQQYNFSISGGNENMRNRLSVMFEDRNSDRKGDDYKKYMANYKLNYAVTKFLDFNFNGTLNYTNDNYSGSGSRIYGTSSPYDFAKKVAPYQMLVNPDGSLARWTNGPITNWDGRSESTNVYGPNYERYVTPVLGQFPYQDWTYNPIEELGEREYTEKTINARVNAGITLKILKGLTFDSKFQYELSETKNREYYTEGSFDVRMRVNSTSTWNGQSDNLEGNFSNDVVDPNLPKGGFIDKATSEYRSYNIRNQISFNRTFEKHSINAIVGTEYSKSTKTMWALPRAFGYDDARMSTSNLPNGDGNERDRYLSTGFLYFFGRPQTVVSKFPRLVGTTFIPNLNGFRTVAIPGYVRDVYFSLYGNASYTYDDKYTLTLSARTDASNFISGDPDKRYSPFWSVGGNWQIGKENFMDNLDWVNRLSLRMSYGFNGIANKASTAKTVLNISPVMNPHTGEIESNITRGYGNPDFGWEKIGQLNIGIDYTLLQGKFFGRFDFYNKNSEALITQVNVPSMTGTTEANLNALEMLNRGFEVEVGTKLPIMGEDISWTGNLNVAYNYNNVTKVLSEPADINALIYGGYLEGYDANALWKFKYAGMQDGLPMIYNKEGEKFNATSTWALAGGPLDYSFYQGTRTAPYTLGFTSNFKIYNFDLSFILTGKFGHEFVRSMYNFSLPTNTNTSISALYRDALNVDPSEGIPMTTEEYNPNLERYSNAQGLDNSVADASHIRFNEINLTYRIPANLTSKYGIKNVRIYGQVNNVARILFNSYGEDPEYRFGNRRATFTFGMKCNF